MNAQVQFARHGDWLIGTAIVRRADGRKVRVHAKANLRQIARLVAPKIAQSVSGFSPASAGFNGSIATGSIFSKISRAVRHTVNRIAHAKILRDIAKTTRGLIKNKAINQALMAAAVAFPPMGVPTMVAFRAANTALDAAEKGGAAMHKLQSSIARLKQIARLGGPMGDKAKKALKVLAVTHRWRRGLRAAQAHAACYQAHRPPPIRLPPQIRGCC